MIRTLLIFLFLMAPRLIFSQVWSPLGSGINAIPSCLSPMEKLYVGTGSSGVNVAGTPANGICTLDENIVGILGSGLSGYANDAEWYNGRLFAAGGFAYAGQSVPYTGRIAAWDTATNTWSSITPTAGVSSDIYCLQTYNGNLYAGGLFLSINNVPVNRIAKWNGTSWSNVSGGVNGGMEFVYCMTIYHGQLYVGGNFQTVGTNNMPAWYIARWNGTQWDSVGGGLNSYVWEMTVDTVADVLYAAGGFTRAGGNTALGVAVWNDTVWAPVGPGTDTLWGTHCLAMYNGELYAGGGNVTITSQGDTINNVYKFNGTKWVSVDGGANNTVEEMCVYEGNLYIGGFFWQVGYGVNASHIACYGTSCPTSVGISESPPPVPFRMYPNPNSDVLRIESEEPQLMTFKLTNSAGQLIAEKTFSKDLNYSLKGLTAGNYFVQVSLQDGSRVHTEKLIVR